MADGYGNQVGYWRCHVSAWVTSHTDTTDTIHVEARWQSVAAGWDYSGWVSAWVWINGRQVNYTGNSGHKYINNSEVVVLSGDLTVAKVDNARNITCKAQINWNGFHPGSSSASCGVSVGGINYKKPNPPKNVKLTRVDDTKIKTTWQANYDNGALKPWKQIILAKREGRDGGNWGTWSDQGGGKGTVLNWDATNYSWTGLRSNARYQFSAYARNQAGDSSHVDSQVIYTTPAAPKSVTAVKTGDRTVQITADVSNTYASWVTLWRRVNGGDWEAVQKDGAHYRLAPSNGKCVFTDSDAPGGTLEYECLVRRVIYGDGSGMSTPLDDTLCSTAKVSNSVTTITPPLAPTVSCEQGAVAPTNTALVLRWTPNHPDGTAQTSAEVEVTGQSGDTTTTTITGDSTQWTRTASLQTVGTVKFRVRTKGLDPDWGAWSAYVEVRIANPPSVVINGPASPVTAMPFTIAWSVADVTGVSMQTVEILRDSNIVYSVSPVTDVRELQITSADFLPSNGDQLQIRVSVRGGSTLTATASILVDVEYTPPDYPQVNIQFNDDCAAVVNVVFGTGDGVPETKYATVYRVNPDGSEKLIVDNLMDGQQCIDVLPPLNTEFAYRVTSHAESGSTQDKIVSTVCESGFAVLNYGADAGSSLLLGYDLSVDHRVSHSTSEFWFASGDSSLPVSYSTSQLNREINADSVFEWDGDLYLRLLNFADEWSYAWYREPSGRTFRVKLDMDVSVDTTERKDIHCALSMIELAWEDPIR